MMLHSSNLHFDENLEIAMVGPPLEEGPLPALFYFALSAKDSLCLDPYNQPVAYLASKKMRIFSITLPFHQPPLDPQNALAEWANAFARGEDIFGPFIAAVTNVIEKIASLDHFPLHQVGVAGLSRGAFIAVHVAARVPFIQHILGYAPLTRLNLARGFQLFTDRPHIAAIVAKYNVDHLITSLIGKNLRFYMGNRDVLVETATCSSFIEQLTEANYQSKIRSPPVELILFPSIGYQGHGTPQTIFEQGAEWMSQKLEAANA